MNYETSTGGGCEGFNSWAERQKQNEWGVYAGDKRFHSRFPYAVRASVELPFMPAKEFGVCDFSRSGMFLAFTDIRATRLSLVQKAVGPGSELVVRFTISLADETHCCRVRARLVRITRHGIGVKFTPNAPWQLTALINLLSRVQEHLEPDPALKS